MTSPFTDERDRIEQALTFDTGCEPSAQEIIDALNRAGFQITPQAGEAEPVATLHADGYWVLNKKHPNYTDIQYQSERGNWRLSVYRTAPPRPACDGNHAAPACADPECWQRPSPVAPELDINTPKHAPYDPEAPENRPHPPVPLGCKGEGFDSEGEPWYGHQFKALLAGRWKCECGKMLYDSPPSPAWQPIESAPSKELVFAISEGDEIEMVLGETVSSAHYDDGEPLYLGWLPREALPPPPDSPGSPK